MTEAAPNSSPSARVQMITERLIRDFAPLQCRLEDESALHAGHAGAASGGGHYRLRLVSERFAGCSRVVRHRLVYDCLAELMHTDIHALAIVALAPSETFATHTPGR